jgi:hypothetical protein
MFSVSVGISDAIGSQEIIPQLLLRFGLDRRERRPKREREREEQWVVAVSVRLW